MGVDGWAIPLLGTEAFSSDVLEDFLGRLLLVILFSVTGPLLLWIWPTSPT